MQYFVASQLIKWSSKRQAYIALSTVEAELAAMFESRVAVQSVLPLVRKLLGLSVCDGPEMAVALRTDNTAAVASTTISGWFLARQTPSRQGRMQARKDRRRMGRRALIKSSSLERFQKVMALATPA